MCGIVGLWDPGHARSEDEAGRLIVGLTDPLAHRGPDSAGYWQDTEAGLSFGHRRLAIVDLSAEGNQPMISASGRFVLVTNGEIYNHHDLRTELQGLGVRFRGHSDTEVMIELIDRCGVTEATRRMAGMFAFALWDRKTRRLTLGRDRLGKKPLYVGFAGKALIAASELKPFAVHPDFERKVDVQALQDVLRRQAVPAPRTIWQDVKKLPAGHLLSLDEADLQRAPDVGLLARSEPYWDLGEIAGGHLETRKAPPFSADEALDRLDEVLGVAVQERMIADVPVGAFLSGGIDSSLVVAMMQKRASQPVTTFTASFGDPEFNEADYAREVAQRLGTDHHEVEITPEIALGVIPSLQDIYDEPFADPSQIPFYHIAKFAREHVTVCLSGDGGDESFAGYGRYFMTEKIARQVGWMPAALRRTLAHGMTAIPPAKLDSALGLLPIPKSFGLRGRLTADRLHKMADLLSPDDPCRLYQQMITLNVLPPDVVLGADPAVDGVDQALMSRDGLEDLMHRMMFRDTLVYLPDDVLVKVDRASMAVSLEARSPLLDHRVVELAWQLPRSYLVEGGQGKWPLRQLLERYLPGSLSGRSKRGFGVPIAAWLRGPLRDWAEDLLDEGRLGRDGFLDPAPIRSLWRDHLSGGRDWSATLWAVLMFQAWEEKWHNPPMSGTSKLNTADLSANNPSLKAAS